MGLDRRDRGRVRAARAVTRFVPGRIITATAVIRALFLFGIAWLAPVQRGIAAVLFFLHVLPSDRC